MSDFQTVLITGCGGMLGNAIYPYFLRKSSRVVATDKVASESWLSELDVRDHQRVNDVFTELKPDLVLHLAAETDLEFCETNPEVARATNADSTLYIAQLAKEFGATLVYISTAGVFDGGKAESYTEADEALPIMVYGQTKLDGERHVRAVGGNSYIVRAGWMVGGGPAKDHKFVSKMLEQIEQGRQVLHAVDDRWGTPTYTHDFANNLFRLLSTGAFGTYHMVCEGSGTRYEVAREIVKACGREDIHVEPVSSDYFAADYFAPRPRSEMLVNAGLVGLGINLMRPWQVALGEYIRSEFGHLVNGRTLASQEQARQDTERRTLADRRRADLPFEGVDRRQLIDRRAIKLDR